MICRVDANRMIMEASSENGNNVHPQTTVHRSQVPPAGRRNLYRNHPPPPLRTTAMKRLESQERPKLQWQASSYSSSDSAISLGLQQKEDVIGLYALHEKIGVGTYGCVRRALHRVANGDVAIKIISKDKLDADGLKKIYREIEVQKRLQHPYIIRVHQVMETDDSIFIVTELAQRGELFEKIKRRGRLTEQEARRYFWQVLSAVKFCHQKGIAHRDIKAENLLLDETDTVKLADFGFCNFYSNSGLLNTFCGSPQYAAPEVFQGISYSGPAVDIWSLGVLLYVFVVGRTPFEGDHFNEIRYSVCTKPLSVPIAVTHDCAMLMGQMLNKDPRRRLSISQIKRSKWMNVDGFEERVTSEIEVHAALERCIPRDRIISLMEEVGVEEDRARRDVDACSFNNVDGIFRVLANKWKMRKYYEMVEGRITLQTFVAAEAAVNGHNNNNNDEEEKAIENDPIVAMIGQAVAQETKRWSASKAVTSSRIPFKHFCSSPTEYPFAKFAQLIAEEARESETESRVTVTQVLHEVEEEPHQESETPASPPPPPAKRDPRMDSIESSEGYGGTESAFSTVPGSLSSVAGDGALRRLPSDVARKMNEMHIGQKRRSIVTGEGEADSSEMQQPLAKRPSLPECLGSHPDHAYRPLLSIRRSMAENGDNQSGSTFEKRKTAFRLRSQIKRHARKKWIERLFQQENEQAQTSSLNTARSSMRFLPPPSLVEGGSFDDTGDDVSKEENVNEEEQKK